MACASRKSWLSSKSVGHFQRQAQLEHQMSTQPTLRLANTSICIYIYIYIHTYIHIYTYMYIYVYLVEGLGLGPLGFRARAFRV